ncbi:MAG: BON domain-containing protein, partial [Holosporales bacterium]|nr:BON domain-containing protein [Holosporales bacterium]
VIKSKLYKVSPELYSAASVSVDRGCVLLTGAVQNPEWISSAEKEAWTVDGVVVVDNNIIVGNIPVSQALQDALITSTCRTSLICSKDIKSVNYKLKTVNGIVYVTGISRSQNELNKTLETLQGVRNVKKIISYVNVIK